MADNSFKARKLADQLADKLKLRLAPLLVTQSFDTDGNPLISINDGSPATTEKNAVIKIQPAPTDTLAKDIFGNKANQYTPHVAQLVTEAPAAGSGAGVYLDLPTLVPILGEVLRAGARFEWYQSANTVVPVAASITGTPKAAFEPSLYWPAISNQ